MEQNELQIETRIQIARRQRSRALGEWIAADWKALRRHISRLLRRDEPSNARSAYPSDCIRYQCLP